MTLKQKNDAIGIYDVPSESQVAGFSRLETRAIQLAESHQITDRSVKDLYLPGSLTDLESIIQSAYQHFRSAPDEELVLSYAAEWLLDNYYLVEQTFRLIKEDLPIGYYRQLPKLASGRREGYPRVYDLACEIIAHDMAQIEMERLHRFLAAYQRKNPLSMGEIWAIPIFLRYGLLVTLASSFENILELPEKIDENLIPALPEMAEVNRDDLVANSFTSLRRLAVQEWKDFFEANSLVEQIFIDDPADIYPRMDFDTRDRYRKVVEDISIAHDLPELAVARACISLAQDAGNALRKSEMSNLRGSKSWEYDLSWGELSASIQSHIGFYLIGKGREQLEKSMEIILPWRERVVRWLKKHPVPIYLSGIALISALVLIAGARYLFSSGGSVLQLLVFLLLGLVPAVTVGVNIVHILATRLVPPRVLPKLDFSKGIHPTCRTMIVIPSLINSEDEINSLIQQLEQHYLRNPDPHLFYALLTDFSDAPTEETPEDSLLIQEALRAVQELNSRYAPDTGASEPFFLFHRKRQWNSKEGVWMGWERKRGKLHELNDLILGRGNPSFTIRFGDLEVLPEIRYIITLDADTILPLGGAARLVGTLAHPLNRPQFDHRTDKVVEGYSVLQPRTEVKPTSANQSLFTRIYAGDAGLDLYTLAVSDVYQDLFGAGIYVGKGIYNVRSFERSLQGRVPENTLLSHDLFEGIFSRVSLVTDIVLYEDFPPSYPAFLHRLHRWIRGDWQLLPWLLPRVPTASGEERRNELAVIDFWKIVDNLRRSLLAPALFVLLLVAWMWLSGSALVWTLALILVPAIPLLSSLVNWVWDQSPDRENASVLTSIRGDAARWSLGVIFLPIEALVAVEAIGTTLFRIFFSRRDLLQWVPAARTNRLLGESSMKEVVFRQFGGASVATAGVGVAIGLVNLPVLWVAFPLLVAWLVSPAVASWISQPFVFKVDPLSEDQVRQLQGLARRTWLFFEQFVGPEDNWLPPDHFQESPRGQVAHRTSPTNIGLMLVSTLAAYDLGYIDLLDLVARLRTTLDSLEKMERYRGHFLNWYDTRSLEPLPPRYVSTVDSGNLAASLIILNQGIQSIASAPVLHWRRWRGLHDTLAMLIEGIRELDHGELRNAIVPLVNNLTNLQRQVLRMKENPSAWTQMLAELSMQVWPELDKQLISLVEAYGHEMDSERLGNLRIYTQRAHHHLYGMQREVDVLFPWISSFASAPEVITHDSASAEIQSAWHALREALPSDLRVEEITAGCDTGEKILNDLRVHLSVQESQAPDPQISLGIRWAEELLGKLSQARLSVQALTIGFTEITRQLDNYVQKMDYGFLFDPQRQIFHIGYNLDTSRLDPNYYDLLASEARIASLVAIAKRDVPQGHWLHLARPFTTLNGHQTLLSWSGTMFEYLMPPLMVQHYQDTLLHQSIIAAVEDQIRYGKEKNIPWGISESGFYEFDANQNYQYRAFGVPGLGFKRGLGKDLVVAPYASILALPIRPHDFMENFDFLANLGMKGTYGFYEAVDFTPSRVPLGQNAAIVRSFMAHHQGMILLALVNYFTNGVMVKRFHSDPRMQSVELLLQELIPRSITLEEPITDEASVIRPDRSQVSAAGWQVPVLAAVPQLNILSNGRFHTIISSSGGGYSRWKDVDLTRWRSDPTLDAYGTWIYLEDQDNGTLWSIGYQPTAKQPDSQEVLFFPHKVEFRRRDGEISGTMEITIPPQDDLEIRTITLVNQGDNVRRLKMTSYAEVILAPQSTDQRHPAFNKLFIESEYLPEFEALLFRRRPRSQKENPLYLIHALVREGETVGEGPQTNFESDRCQFLGRGQSTRRPAAFQKDGGWLSQTAGATLDPVMALGREFDLSPHTSVRFAFITVAAGSRPEAIERVGRYRNWPLINRAFDAARSHIEIDMRRLGLVSSDLESIQRLLSVLLQPHKLLRAGEEILASNTQGQPGLWGHAISGDYPILLFEFESQEDLPRLAELLRAHAYWRSQDIKIDLVILNQQETGYAQELMNQVRRLITRMGGDSWINQHGGLFLILADQMTPSGLILLQTAARVILRSDRGSLKNQLQGLFEMPNRLPPFIPTLAGEIEERTPTLELPSGLKFANDHGGFSSDGCEYIIYLQPEQWTPAPWINVIANEQFGFLVSETGSSYTWAVNSGENRLTPWSNDPVLEWTGEAVYLRDEESGKVWTPTALPSRGQQPYLARHGAGYSTFEHNSNGLRQSLRMFVPKDDPVKIMQLRLENTWNRVRRITATLYAEWVLGIHHELTWQYIIPEFDTESQSLLVKNPYNEEFGERVAFAAASKNLHGLTADRLEFLGHLGSRSHPASLNRIGLSSRVEPGDDPCAALQVHLDIHPGETVEVHFLIGQGGNREHAIQLVNQYRDISEVSEAWSEVTGFWEDLLDRVQVETPDPAMDLLLNRWLLYQALSCRIWGRSAFYQSSGAYGFRDQLQDVMSQVYAAPEIARAHLIRAAGHQFEAGDVLHWWHPPSGRGVRTRFSDDLIWLPFVTEFYVSSTGDDSVLDERAPFRKGPLLEPGEEERYGLFPETSETFTLYEHCQRSLEKGATFGPHGLPLMGGGDWNDGMNRVGIEGRGESVWLGWFLIQSLEGFARICERRGDDQLAERYRNWAAGYKKAIESNAWDGAWYLRAFYDDGSPLGSAENRECQIDSLSQSWAVLTEAGDPLRSRQGMDAVAERLISYEDRLILLFAPPFDKTPRDPGYIRGYLPGIRENGGQYTHAALWTIWAYARLGLGDLAGSLFRMINPIYHTDSLEKVERYKVEPYVIAADVYGVPPHTGQGGWTWYTGSSGWSYRLGLEALLGFRLERSSLRIDPCIPKDWKGYRLRYRFGSTVYQIDVKNPHGVNQGVKQLLLDGKVLPEMKIDLADDGNTHDVIVHLG